MRILGHNDKVSPITRFWHLVQHKTILVQALVGNIIYRFRTGHVHLYSKITDYVLVDGNRKLLNLLSISMIAIVLLQVHWFKKECFCDENRTVD
jgi:ATP-binding cassette subfamily B protein